MAIRSLDELGRADGRTHGATYEELKIRLAELAELRRRNAELVRALGDGNERDRLERQLQRAQRDLEARAKRIQKLEMDCDRLTETLKRERALRMRMAAEFIGKMDELAALRAQAESREQEIRKPASVSQAPPPVPTIKGGTGDPGVKTKQLPLLPGLKPDVLAKVKEERAKYIAAHGVEPKRKVLAAAVGFSKSRLGDYLRYIRENDR